MAQCQPENEQDIEIAFAEQNVILAREALLRLFDTEQVNKVSFSPHYRIFHSSEDFLRKYKKHRSNHS